MEPGSAGVHGQLPRSRANRPDVCVESRGSPDLGQVVDIRCRFAQIEAERSTGPYFAGERFTMVESTFAHPSQVENEFVRLTKLLREVDEDEFPAASLRPSHPP